MVVLSNSGMTKIERIQEKYKFKNNFQLEMHDIYDFCGDIKKAYHLGLCIDKEDLEFIDMVLEKLCE